MCKDNQYHRGLHHGAHEQMVLVKSREEIEQNWRTNSQAAVISDDDARKEP